MSGKVSDLPIRNKHAVFTQKKLDRINFRSGNGGRVLRNPPGVTRCWSRAWSHDSLVFFCLLSIIDCIDSSAHSSTSVRSSSRFQLLALSAILHDNDRERLGARSAMVSVLPSGIDVRKLQRSHSEISRVEALSDLPSRLFFGLPIRFSYPI